MTDRSDADMRSTMAGPSLAGVSLRISKLLAVAIVVATAATGAFVILLLGDMPPRQPPPGPAGLPPPLDLQPLALFSVVTGFFVLSWLAVLVVVARDQILHQLRQQVAAGDQPAAAPGVSRDELGALLAGLRSELADDRKLELDSLAARVEDLTSEFGERRETDGYLNGMRTAAPGAEAKVHPIRRTPPQR